MLSRQEEKRLFLREVRQRHPAKTTLAGALLAEILTPSEISHQRNAAFEFIRPLANDPSPRVRDAVTEAEQRL